jgi:flagellum-specific peptidoglycan hydrolase FlgJ
MKLRVFTILFIALFLASCGSSKKVVKKSPGFVLTEPIPEPLPSVKQIQHVKKLVRGKSKLNKHKLNYIRKYAPIAVDEMHSHNIPASITLAQGILESGSGRSGLALKSNNHFGIKCHTGWKGQRVYHDDDAKGECFRKYQYVETSYNDHSLFLTQRSRYAFLFKLNKKDYKAWAKGLKKAGYATDRKYPQKLIKLIKEYKLYEFDKIKKNWKKNRKSKRSKVKKESRKKNRGTYHKVRKGETLYAIARRFDITVAKLKSLNRLKGNEISIGQRLLVE